VNGEYQLASRGIDDRVQQEEAIGGDTEAGRVACLSCS